MAPDDQMPSNDPFSEKVLLLHPEKATVLDLLRIMFSDEIEGREFMKDTKATVAMLERRWIIFYSLTGQMFLQRVVPGPLSWVGSKLGKSGNMEVPEKELNIDASTIKTLQKRKYLDLLPPEDVNYFYVLCTKASNLAYETKPIIQYVVEKHWKMNLLDAKDFWNDKEEHYFFLYQRKKTTKAFMFHDPNPNHDMIVVAFRGTDPFNAYALSTDIDIFWCKFGKGNGKVHGGFMKALGLQEGQAWPKNVRKDDEHLVAYYTIRQKLRDFFRTHPKTKFIVTGHSLGGALAILFSAVLILLEESDILERLEAVYTFGQPMVGNQKFVEFMERKFKLYDIKYFRAVNDDDAVPRLPFKALDYKHFGKIVYYDTNYVQKIVNEDPEKNYFSLSAYINRGLNKAKEARRSLINAFTAGPENRRRWLQTFWRIYTMIPGVSAHLSNNYVDAAQHTEIPIDD